MGEVPRQLLQRIQVHCGPQLANIAIDQRHMPPFNLSMADELIKETPRVLACILCDQIIDDRTTRKKTLVGTFNQISARTFPACHPSLVVFLALTGGQGEYDIQLRLRLSDGEHSTILELSGPIQFDNPLHINEMSFTLNGVVFPEPGRYTFEVSADNGFLAERPFTVAAH
jgi:hypothetical protein